MASAEPLTPTHRPGRGRGDLALLEIANAVGGVSNALVMVVIPWLVLERTGSPALAGLVGALSGLPGIVVAPLVGALVDRVGRRLVSVASDLLSAVSVLLFPILDALGLLGIGVVIGLAVLGGAFDPAGYTARKAMIPDTAAAAGVDRDQVNGLHEGIFAAGWVVGPMAGAFLIASVGAVNAMWVAGAAFLVAAVTVAVMRVPNRTGATPGEPALPRLPGEAADSVWRSSLVGLRVLVADRPVWILTLAVAAVWLIYLPTESVLLPVHFEDLGEPESFGFVLSALAAGGMAGAFGYGWLARRLSRFQLAWICMLLAGVAYVPLAFLPGTAVMVVAGLALGLAWGPMEPLLNSLVQDRFPADQHGRVFGVQLAIFYAAPPLGQLFAGLAAERYDVQPVLALIAALLVLVGVTVRFAPLLRDLDRPRLGAAVPEGSGSQSADGPGR